MAGTMRDYRLPPEPQLPVSMESGLDGRNNEDVRDLVARARGVSMESGLDGRNNILDTIHANASPLYVSMESGLDGRNNPSRCRSPASTQRVSMESGLDGRNNRSAQTRRNSRPGSLNGVRPRWPEQ